VMNPRAKPAPPDLRSLLEINRLCDEFEAACRDGHRPKLEAYLARAGAGAPALLENLLPIDIEYRRRREEQPTLDEYVARFPALDRERLARFFRHSEDGPFPATLGEYDLVRRIGSGGMAVVYLARHRRMNRNVALKAIAPDSPESEVLLQRFAREVEITARLSHPNVVAALDAREDQGTVYLVTSYYEGGDLGRLVRRSGPLPVRDAIRYTRAAARGLAHAHARGVIHRDVKPSNLLLDGDGRVCVADWGLARTRDGGPVFSRLTATGIIIGTVDYLAPEQAGQSEKADARSDVYSLGCVLFFLLVGRAPFNQGTIWERLDAHQLTPAPDVRSLRPELPAAVAELVARMLAKRPEDRPANMNAVVDALDALAPAPERPEAAHETGSRAGPSRRKLLRAGVALGLLAATGYAISRAFPHKRTEGEPPPPPPELPPTRPPAPAIAEMPFANAKEYQRRWADHLGVPVERTETVGAVSFRFVLIPPGTFRMGSPADQIAERVARPNIDEWTKGICLAEKERRVTVRRAFYLGRTEVTHEQFKLFVARTGYQTLAERTGSGWGYYGPEEKWKLGAGFSWKSAGEYLPGPDHPAINIGSNDAVAFCKWLGKEAGATCRLPAESEWEFACRGGRYGYWGHGDDAAVLTEFAVYGVDVPLAVGTRKPNGFGLFDMHGNASERCAIEDPWTDDPARSPDLGGLIYPVRGGRFNEVLHAAGVWPEAYRAARRSWEPPSSLAAGFRVLREVS
jgi:serine/threonine protein kinase/formylglycine-generating enzyme required for sulfatase activity